MAEAQGKSWFIGQATGKDQLERYLPSSTYRAVLPCQACLPAASAPCPGSTLVPGCWDAGVWLDKLAEYHCGTYYGTRSIVLTVRNRGSTEP